mgnify:FL=1
MKFHDDKVLFYIRSDFGKTNKVEKKYIYHGDSMSLKHYINLFMKTEEGKTSVQLNVEKPDIGKAAFLIQ